VSKPQPNTRRTTSQKQLTFALPPPKGLFPAHTAAAPLITESTVSPTYLPTVSLASFSSFLGLTFLTALLATLSTFSLIFGVAEAFFLLSSGFSAAFFAAETAFLAVALGLAAAFLAVAVALVFAGDLEVAFFFVMPVDLVREPAPEEEGFFFFWGEGAAAGLGAEALAFSWGGRVSELRLCESGDDGSEMRLRWP
jgi:hypothetical protein